MSARYKKCIQKNEKHTSFAINSIKLLLEMRRLPDLGSEVTKHPGPALVLGWESNEKGVKIKCPPLLLLKALPFLSLLHSLALA